MSELTLSGLRVLREVAARGSFTAAATALGYTQSSVSRQIAALEAAAGAPLFVRAARGVRLTDAGHVLLRHGGDALGRLDLARQELTALHGRAGAPLRLGGFPSAMGALVPRAMAAYRSDPRARAVTVREGTTAPQLRRLAVGRLDLAVVGSVTGEPLAADERLALTPLLDDPLLLAVGRGHRLVGAVDVELDDLAAELWIAGSATVDETFLAALDRPWRPRVEHVVREWTAKLGLVAAGLGVTFVPGIAAAAMRPDVVPLRVHGVPSRSVLLARPAGRPASHTQELARTLHHVGAQLVLELSERLRHQPITGRPRT